MGSILDSRYWVCPKCCRQYDWNYDLDKIRNHNCVEIPKVNEEDLKMRQLLRNMFKK